VSLFTELKRRNVFRVGIAYAVASWLLIQVTDILFESIGAPPWVMQAMFVILAAGLVIALIFAWAFELTPEGVKKERDVDHSDSITPITGQKLNKAIATLLVIALAYIAYDKLLSDKNIPTADSKQSEPTVQSATPVNTTPTETADIQKSIVVLPFVNMSNDPEQEFFSDGLSEELLNVLAQIKDLRVISRTSAFAFKGKDLSIPEIAAVLNVSHVLEGSVRRSGEEIRITAQLIEVATDSHLWSDAYNRKLENIFEIQEEISKAIAHELQVSLGTGKKSGNSTNNLEAYQLFLRGRDLYQRRVNFTEAVGLFQQVVDLDPEFAEGWANLGAVTQLASYWDNTLYREYRARSTKAIERAISLDPKNGLANAVRGMHYQHELRWDEALSELDRAIELNPNESNSLLYKGEVLLMLGYFEDAIKVMKQAEEVDPVFANLQAWISSAYIQLGKYDLAKQHIHKLQQLDPEKGAKFEINLAVAAGQFSLAKSLALKDMEPEGGLRLLTESYYNALIDPTKTDSAVKIIRENKESMGNWGIFGYLAGLGEVDAAVDYWLSLRSEERYTRSGNYLQHLWEFPKDRMSDPRYLQFLEDTGVADYWRKHGDPDTCSVNPDNSVRCGET
jgi:TolB-like protein